MSKRTKYWIFGAVLLNLITMFVVSRVVLNNIEEKSIKFSIYRDLELDLEEGTYYLYSPFEIPDYYVANDYGNTFYLAGIHPPSGEQITLRFDLSRNQESITLDSILHEYKTPDLFGSPFATFEIDEDGEYVMNTEFETSSGYSPSYYRYHVSNTHPRVINTLESISVISGFLLVLTVLGLSGLIYWDMKYEENTDKKET